MENKYSEGIKEKRKKVKGKGINQNRYISNVMLREDE